MSVIRNRRGTTNRPLRYARYLRCSSDDQAHGDFTTIDNQDDLTLRYLAEHGGVDAGKYADEGRTGTNLNRPDWRRMLQDAEAREFDAVLCTYMSRLGRGDAFTIAEYLLKEQKIPVVMVEERFTKDVAGYTQQSITKFLDGMYPVQVREWTMTKLKSMFEKGYHVGGRIPFGFISVPVEGTFTDKAPRILLPCPDTAPFVVEAFDLFLMSRATSKVRDYLERVSGKSWSISHVRHLLTAPYYIGTAVWNQTERENTYEPIIERAVFDAVQEILTTGTRKRGHPEDEDAKAPYAYYMRGLLYCSCGQRMTNAAGTSRHGNVIRYYQCPSRHCRAAEGKQLRVNAAKLHRSLVSEVSQMAQHSWRSRRRIEQVVEQMPDSRSFDKQIEATRRKLRETERGIEKLTTATTQAPSSAIPALLRRIGTDEEKRVELVSELARLEKEQVQARWRPTIDEVVQAMQRFTDVWNEANDEERSELVTLAVDRAEMKNRAECVATLLPDFVVFEREGSNKPTIKGPRRLIDRTLRLPVIITIK